MTTLESIQVIEDLLISVRNHKRGTASMDIKDLERFAKRDEAVSYALRVLRSMERHRYESPLILHILTKE